MSTLVQVSSQVVRETLDEIQRAGSGARELVIAWHGKRLAEGITVTRFSIPKQTGTKASFSVSDIGMQHLRRALAAQGELVAAQVHAHPGEAFHSLADDSGALVGHLGALSIVIPDFAANCTVSNFSTLAAVFELDGSGRWRQVSRSSLAETLWITDI